MVEQIFNLSQLTPKQKQQRLDVLRISYEQKYSHLGSCLTAIDAIEAVYQIKKPNDVFVLSNGHAGVAWYVVLKDRGLIDESQLKSFNIHPDRQPDAGIEVSTGSLGQGLPIAVGLAKAEPNFKIFCMISDGECAEGSVWESFRFISDYQVSNLVILLNANGWGAYDRVPVNKLITRIKAFEFEMRECDGHNQTEITHLLTEPIKMPTLIVLHTTNNQLPFLNDQDAHYYVMNEKDWRTSQELLK